MMEEDKIFFTPGDVVTIRLELPNKPIMMVYKVEKSIIRGKGEDGTLKGIRCRWFTSTGSLEENVFNTKDLIKI